MGNTLRILGIDISAWQGRPSPAWFRSVREAGYEAFIAQLWGGTPDGLGPSRHAAYQLQQAAEAGFLALGGYIYLPPDTTTYTTEIVRLALQATGGAKLDLVAIDIEAGQLLHHTHPYGRLVDCLSRVQAAWPDAQAVIYTRRNIWAVNLGVDNPWPGGKPPVPLWEARYVLPSGQAPDAPPDLDWQWQPFGGWAERAGLQYAGTATLLGVGADLNVFDLSRMGIVGKLSAPIEEEIDMSQLQDILNRLSALEGRVSALEAKVQAPPPPPPGPPTHTVGPEGARGLWGVWEARGRPLSWQEWYDRTCDLNGWPRGSSPVLQVGMVIKVAA